MFNRVLFPVENEEIEDELVNKLAELAAIHRATVTILHSYDVTIDGVNFNTYDENKVTDIFRKNASVMVANLEEKFRNKGMDAYTMLAKGDPAKVIVEVANTYNFDLVVMSNRRGIKRLFSKNVSNYATHYCLCPVMVYPRKN